MNNEESEIPVLPAPLAPWRTMWLHPRLTIRAIVDSADPTQSIYRLAALRGVKQALSEETLPAALFLHAYFGNTGEIFASIAAAVIVGILFGLLGMKVSGAVTGAIGRALGGVATNDETRTALAWAGLPTIAGLPLALLFTILASLGKGELMVTPTLTVGQTVFAVLNLWTVILTVAALAEVHRVSLVRAFGILVIPVLVLLLLALLLTGIGSLLR